MLTHAEELFLAFMCLVGQENTHWTYLPIDEVEYLDPYYGHQN
jgi:hypothetical protein